MKSFSDIIRLWPNPRSMADAIGAGHWAVAKWQQRDRIPPEWWLSVIRAAAAAGYQGVTLDQMAKIASSGLSKAKKGEAA